MPGTFPSMEGHLLPTLSPLLRDMDLRPVMALPNQKKACFGMGEPSFLIHLQTEPAAGKSSNAHIVRERSLSRDGRAPFFYISRRDQSCSSPAKPKKYTNEVSLGMAKPPFLKHLQTEPAVV